MRHKVENEPNEELDARQQCMTAVSKTAFRQETTHGQENA
jgi:hypothetical protein